MEKKDKDWVLLITGIIMGYVCAILLQLLLDIMTYEETLLFGYGIFIGSLFIALITIIVHKIIKSRKV